MTRPIPSHWALHHLARLCALESLPRATRPSPCTANRHIHNQPPPFQRRHLGTSLRLRQSTSSQTATQPSVSPSSASSHAPPPTLPDTTNYYTLFPHTLPDGPPPRGPFTIPLPVLRREFLKLQSLYHPDKYPTTTSTTSSNSTNTTKPLPTPTNLAALSTLLNTAYTTLSTPLLRAQYLLLQHSIDVTSEDNSAHATDNTTLMEVMDAQEAIESAGSEDEIEVLKTENRARMRETEDGMGRAFEKGDVEGARRECVRLKYWVSLQQGLDDWEEGKEVRLVH